MIVLHVDSTTNNVNMLNTYIKNGKKVFILFYMDGCGPCNETRPEWKKIENVLRNKYDDTVVIADVEQEALSQVKYLIQQPKGFPTMILITNHGKTQQDYEDSQVKTTNRTIDSFVEWIEMNVKPTTETKKYSRKRRTRRLKKYKKSLKHSKNQIKLLV